MSLFPHCSWETQRNIQRQLTTIENKTWTETKTPTATYLFYIFLKKNLQVSKNRFFTQRLNSFESYKHRIRSSLNRLTREVVSKETKVKRNTFCCKKEKKNRYLCMYNNKKNWTQPLNFHKNKVGQFFCV